MISPQTPVTESRMPSETAEPPVFTRVSRLARDIKLSHSVFALPFALLATYLAAASVQERPEPRALALIVLCMVLARTMAMSFNRWADHRIDAQNPRTIGRALPAGDLTPGFVLGIALACAAGFIIATAGFWVFNDNLWPVVLSPFVLAWLVLYSFTKRFTWLCHLFLGSALALSPLAASIAIKPPFLSRPEPYLLAVMVMCWVGGFDIIYALLDIDVDRRNSIHSMPARWGVERALWISRVLHLIALAALLVLAEVSPDLGVPFAAGIVAVVTLLLLQHAVVWRSGTHHIPLAFFTLNGLISLLLGALGIFDVIQSA